MKLNYKVNNNITVELDVTDTKDAVEQLAQLDEVLGNDKCGKCKSTNVTFQVREVDGNKFYEMRCKDCGATLSFGVHRKGGTLFPKRYLEKDDKRDYSSGGWAVWDGTRKV